MCVSLTLISLWSWRSRLSCGRISGCPARTAAVNSKQNQIWHVCRGKKGAIAADTNHCIWLWSVQWVQAVQLNLQQFSHSFVHHHVTNLYPAQSVRPTTLLSSSVCCWKSFIEQTSSQLLSYHTDTYLISLEGNCWLTYSFVNLWIHSWAKTVMKRFTEMGIHLHDMISEMFCSTGLPVWMKD